MQRPNRITLLLALPVILVACKDPDDNLEDTGADETSAEGSSSFTSTTTATTGPTSTTEPTSTTDPDTGSESAETGQPTNCVSADDAAAPKTMIDAEINTDTTLTCDTVWVLTNAIYVRGATLTIEAGTHIAGASGSALIIEKDANIQAIGTANAPIVFTSAQPKGSRARADWGGLVMIGEANVNLPNGVGQAEGFADPPTYGGTDPAHNCGSLEYVRVEWAGFELVEGSELNGVTWYACGTGSTANYVQSHMGSDDAFEWFGGSMDAKYLVASGQADDALDCDQGFTGNFQYVFVHQDPAEPDGNHGLEWSNQGTDFAATPLTSPAVANMTFIGQGDGGNAGKSIGFVLKEGTEAEIYSSYFTNVTGFGASFQDEQTITVTEGGGVTISGSQWGNHGGFGIQGDAITWDATAVSDFILMDQVGNMDAVDLAIDLTWTAPNVKPAAGGPADGAGMTPGSDFFDATTYVGAVDPNAADDWTQAGWINYAVD